MLLFCPTCSNSLTVHRHPSTGQNALTCPTCPYNYPLTRRLFERRNIRRKEVDDILGGEGSWDNVDNTEVQCPDEVCGGERAYFYMVQIRSADEPMTTFYKCMKCGHKWREG
ncbi:RNA polymerase III C11 subunit [Orbilia javanica]|uniref:DNA-directed RNA polymerase subunit n=1 Tax=Orbilia javanica TaxID=47235 RepID=A0AAN8R8X8_9PEZI